MKKTNILLILAIIFGLAFHGSAIFFTLEETYDAYIHLFFAGHYADNWFEHWNYKWYTGFTVHGYPPLVHQGMALLSLLGGLKFGLYSIAILSIVLFVTGVYRYGLLMSGRRDIAGYTTILAVLSTAFLETLHLFGQLPSIIGLSLLLHALPEIYLWIRQGTSRHFFTSLSLIAVMVSSHHVTPIFGMVFFVFPLIGMVIMDNSQVIAGDFKKVTLGIFYRQFKKVFWRITGFGISSLVLIILCILPYWINTKKNPITQVPIPHGSRDNFLEITSSGLVFFLIPWGILLFLLPYFFYRFYSKRYLFFGLSFSLLTLLGTGGTTPLPRMILGENAFNILTLDRFTLWATMMALPIFGEFAYRFARGDIRDYLQNSIGSLYHRLLGGFLAMILLFSVVFTMSLGYFRPAQPEKIKMLPIVNFLNQDQHDQWRYLTLGFGDQMAWLSALTDAKTVDGNYHSARRLPELTSRAIERLENSKYKGIEGIGSLQQFLTTPEKYHLKFVFSNDKFYDPLLFFCGWQRVDQLENGVMVWERLNVSPLPAVLPREDVPQYLKLMWGLIPVATVLLALLLNVQLVWWRALKMKKFKRGIYEQQYAKLRIPGKLIAFNQLWGLMLCGLALFAIYSFYLKNADQYSPQNIVEAYYDALDFKEFEQAYSFLDPEGELTLEQYMLHISTTDGLLSSYAKMNEIEVIVVDQSINSAAVNIFTKWVTPLESIDKEYKHQLVKKDGKWYIRPDRIATDIPPDQLFTQSGTTYFNQGRRRVGSQKTYYEDILEQPLLRVLSSKLVKYRGRYSIVGEVQNIDQVPADIMIRSTLYADNGSDLAEYDAKYHLKHKLLPRESTVFRIDFEDVSWQDVSEEVPNTFQPDQFTPAIMADVPSYFNLQCAGNISNKGLHKNLALQHIESEGGRLHGTIYNSGIQEVTIPQLLVSYYNQDRELLWVDHRFLEEGIRVGRKKDFTYPLPDLSGLKVINKDLSLCFVNGLPNPATDAADPQGYFADGHALLQTVDDDNFTFFKLDFNAYVGNPK